jgi:hypothetical protein
MTVSIQHAIMLAIMARLNGPTPVIDNPDRIRRSHKTAVSSATAPAVYADDGDDDLRKGDDCHCDRVARPAVRIFVNGDADDALADADVIKVGVLARLNPADRTHPYPNGVAMTHVRSRFEDDVEDGDAVFLTLEFEAKYSSPMWAPTI